jgi:thioredoxin-related protein
MNTHFAVRRALIAAALLLFAVGFAAPAAAAELVMFRRAGCPYCAAFDRAIGPIYPKTDIGKRLPLRQIDLDHSADAKVAKVVLLSPVRFTPTFVLVESGREIGRLEGYPGEDFFWGLLERLLLQHRL